MLDRIMDSGRPGAWSRQAWRIALVTVCALGLLSLLNFDFQLLLASLEGIRTGPAALGLAAFVVAHVAFAARWYALIGDAGKPAFGLILRYSFIGGMLNVILPMRAGDLARALLLARNHGMGLGDTGGTVAAERLADAVTLVLLGAGLTTMLALPEATVDGLVGISFLLAAAFGSILLAWRLSRHGNPWPSVERHLPRSIAVRLKSGLLGFVEAWNRMRNPKVAFLASLAHAIGWAAVGIALAAFLASLSVPAPYAQGALGVLVITGLGGIVVNSPAGIGAWHLLAAGALTIWSVPVETGIAYALVAHGIGISVPVAGGLVACLLSGTFKETFRLGRASRSS